MKTHIQDIKIICELMNIVGYSPFKDYMTKDRVMTLAELINMAISG